LGKSLLSSDERPRYGVTISALVDGRVYTTVSYGPTQEALVDAIAALERRGSIEEVLSISTPDTIYRDLQGTRRREDGFMAFPETSLLTRVGRSDLAPIPKSSEAMHKRRARIRREEKLLAETGNRATYAPKPKKKRLRIRLRLWTVRCRGVTTKGRQCKHWALPGRKVCAIHARLREERRHEGK